MGVLLLGVFVVVGLAEFLTFTWIVQTVFRGELPIAIVVLIADSIFGALLVKQEGRKAWHRFRTALGRGVTPPEQVIDGALILFGGALLLTPGFITDIVGVVCVLGPTRTIINRLILGRALASAGIIGVLGRTFGGQPRAARPPVDASGREATGSAGRNGGAAGRSTTGTGRAQRRGRAGGPASSRSTGDADGSDSGGSGSGSSTRSSGTGPGSPPPGGTRPGDGSTPPPGVIDVEVVEVKRTKRRDSDSS